MDLKIHDLHWIWWISRLNSYLLQNITIKKYGMFVFNPEVGVNFLNIWTMLRKVESIEQVSWNTCLAFIINSQRFFWVYQLTCTLRLACQIKVFVSSCHKIWSLTFVDHEVILIPRVTGSIAQTTGVHYVTHPCLLHTFAHTALLIATCMYYIPRWSHSPVLF